MGKDALLEAEVELRAYWDRTGAPSPSLKALEDKSFRLDWAFAVRIIILRSEHLADPTVHSC